jgi:uncharacterized membrane protein
MKFREALDEVRHSLWFIPTLCTVAAAAAALLLIWVASATDLEAEELPLLFGAGADGARAMLQAIAGSIITVAGVIFSVTIIALQQTSTQYSPRVLRNFMSDRGNQLVLGVFVGTFTYALLVLRSIKAENGGEEFVPAIAISGALVLTLVAVGMLIYFIHHISQRIQVTSILSSVASETIAAHEDHARWWQSDDEHRWRATRPGVPPTVPPSEAIPATTVADDERLLNAAESGYLQLVDIGALVKAAVGAEGTLRLLLAPGAWVQRGAPVAAFRPAEGASTAPDRSALDGLADRLTEALAVGHERSLQQDVAFGVQQLADIAAKGLSPGMNDPTTAINAIDRLVEVLTAVGAADDPPRGFEDGDGTVRLEIPYPTYNELVGLGFDPIRRYGATDASVVVHLARAWSILRSALPPGRHAAIREQARRMIAAAESIELEADRTRPLEALRPLLD